MVNHHLYGSCHGQSSWGLDVNTPRDHGEPREERALRGEARLFLLQATAQHRELLSLRGVTGGAAGAGAMLDYQAGQLVGSRLVVDIIHDNS